MKNQADNIAGRQEKRRKKDSKICAVRGPWVNGYGCVARTNRERIVQGNFINDSRGPAALTGGREWKGETGSSLVSTRTKLRSCTQCTRLLHRPFAKWLHEGERTGT